jgi:hypothetical protein
MGLPSDGFMNGDHVGGQEGSYEPQRQSNILLFVQPDESDLMTLCLQSFPIPQSENTILTQEYLNEQRKFAGRVTYTDMEVVFKDYVDNNVAQLLQKWRYKVHDPDSGKIGLARNYKKKGFIWMYSPEASVVRKYDLFGIWPASFNHGEADMSGDDTQKITMNFAVDRIVPRQGLNPGAQIA